MANKNIIVRGFSKVGTIVNDDPADPFVTVEFEKIKIRVDKATQTIVLPSGCVTIQNF